MTTYTLYHEVAIAALVSALGQTVLCPGFGHAWKVWFPITTTRPEELKYYWDSISMATIMCQAVADLS